MDNEPVYDGIWPDWQVFENAPHMGALGAITESECLAQGGKVHFGVCDLAGSRFPIKSASRTFWMIAGTVGLVLGIYHGAKRNTRHPFWGGTGYGALGATVPIVGIPVMLVQGVGKPKSYQRNARRRRRRR